jgi:hypothetical protein
VGALIVTPVQATNLIQNGSFENGANPGLFQTINAVSTVITGWTVSQGSSIISVHYGKLLMVLEVLIWRDQGMVKLSKHSTQPSVLLIG